MPKECGQTYTISSFIIFTNCTFCSVESRQ